MHLTGVDVNGEMALLVSGSDVVVNISVGANIFTRSVNLYHLGTHRHIFRKRGQIVSPLKHGRIVINVQNRDRYIRKGREADGNALIWRTDRYMVWGLNLAVQQTLQNNDPRWFINGEEPINRINKGIDHFAINTCKIKHAKSHAVLSWLTVFYHLLLRTIIHFSCCHISNASKWHARTQIGVYGLYSGQQSFSGGVLVDTSGVMEHAKHRRTVIHVQKNHYNLSLTPQTAAVRRTGNQRVLRNLFTVQCHGCLQLAYRTTKKETL